MLRCTPVPRSLQFLALVRFLSSEGVGGFCFSSSKGTDDGLVEAEKQRLP